MSKKERERLFGTIINCDNNNHCIFLFLSTLATLAWSLPEITNIFYDNLLPPSTSGIQPETVNWCSPLWCLTWERRWGGWRSGGTVAAETDAAETFKMHAPLIGNRADCVREKGNERRSSLCLGWGEGGREWGVSSNQWLRTQQRGLEEWNRSGVAW